MIDNYLAFQVAVIALIPALLYLAGRKKYGNAFGVFLAIMTALQGLYAITLYREVGSVNVKLENPEVLTALFLVLLSFAAFRWLSEPATTRWAILSGGILGLAVLLRFNPLFIAPFLVLAVLLVRKQKIKTVLPGILLFALAFALAFSPWFFSATNEYGKNHYFTKIEEVISSRFSTQRDSGTQEVPTEQVSGTQPTPVIESPEPPPGEVPVGEELLSMNWGRLTKPACRGFSITFSITFTPAWQSCRNLVLHPIEEQVTDGIWTFTEAQPIWKTSLRVENLLALALNLVLVLIGVMAAWRRFGVAGLTGIIIQVGYYAGNAFSQTSGGRYLEPVFWILIVYYCLGIYTLTMLGIRAFSRNEEVAAREVESETGPVMGPQRKERKWVPKSPVLLAGFLAFGMILPALNLIPEKLPDETDSAVEATAFEVLSQRGLVTEEQWHNFLQDPNRILIQGRAYQPRYYRGDFFTVPET